MFADDERSIFRYSDAEDARRGDPVEIEWELALALEGQDVDALKAAADGPDRIASIRAGRTMLPAIRRAFGVRSIGDDPEHGLTAEETFGLMVRFMEWSDRLKADGASTPK